MRGFEIAIASAETTSDKTSFPDFPGENPDKKELKEWLDVFKDDLETHQDFFCPRCQAAC